MPVGRTFDTTQRSGIDDWAQDVGSVENDSVQTMLTTTIVSQVSRTSRDRL